MDMSFDLPIIYRNKGVPPYHSLPQDYYVLDKATFRFPVASVYELEPALTYRFRHTPDDGGPEHVHDTVFNQCGGHLVRPVPTKKYGEIALDTTGLALLEGQWASDLPEQLWNSKARYGYVNSSTKYPVSKLKPKHIEESRRNAAIEQVQRQIDESLVLVDGMLYGHVPDPSIRVHIHDDEISADRCITADGMFNFPVDCPELADEFVEWACNEYGLRIKRDKSWGRDSEIILDSPHVPLSSNPLLLAVSRLCSFSDLNIVNHAPYGEDVKRLGLEFQENETVENGMNFLDALEAAALGRERRDVRPRFEGDTRFFAIFRKFVDLIPEGYKEGHSSEISVPMLNAP